MEQNISEGRRTTSATNRLAAPPLETLKEHLRTLLPPRQRPVGQGVSGDDSTRIGFTRLECELSSHAEEMLIVSVSHDDYLVNYGGVQTLIGDEQESFCHAHLGYLHISPTQPLWLMADPSPGDSFVVSLRFNGAFIGIASFADLIAALASRRNGGGRARLVCHHLLGQIPELISELHRTASTEEAVFWIHDFFTLCPNFALMRNDIAFCGAPHPDSDACYLCCYGHERADHGRRIDSLFRALNPIVLAPSGTAFEFWRSRSNLPHSGCEVVPHARVLLADQATDPAVASNLQPIRVAHLGAAAMLKGWHVFKDLARRHRDDDRYSFFYLGSERPIDAAEHLEHIRVRVTPTNRHAMVEAIAEARIDIVLIWSFAFETFSYVAHEALAGGAFVVTRLGSGNVWPAVSSIDPSQGLALDDERALFDLFEHGHIRDMLDQSRRRFGAVIPGGGTGHWLLYGYGHAIDVAQSDEQAAGA